MTPLRIICTGCLVIILLSSCKRGDVADEPVLDEVAVVGEIQDLSPYEFVTDHLFAKPSDYWPSQGKPLNRIYVFDETNGWTFYVSEGQLQGELEKWTVDVSRISQSYLSFKGSKFQVPDQFRDERIEVVSTDELETAVGEAGFYNENEEYTDKIYLGFWPPVFIDGLCFVRFRIGPTPHGATGTFLLRPVGDTWEIVEYRFAFYV